MATINVHYIPGDVSWVDEAKNHLEQSGVAHLVFCGQSGRALIIRSLYRYFRGYTLQWEYKDPTCKEVPFCMSVVISGTPVRSLPPDGDEGGLNPTGAEEHANKLGNVPVGFMEETPKGYIRCPICHRLLPADQFAWRSHQERYRQSYCRECMSMYQHWRGQFLRTHNADTLMDRWTPGHKIPNQYFLEWYKDQEKENFPWWSKQKRRRSK